MEQIPTIHKHAFTNDGNVHNIQGDLSRSMEEITMIKTINDILFRSLGTHALKEISISQGQLTLVVAPWTDLEDEATAIFSDMEIIYIEAERDSEDQFLDFNLPWDIIRFDSKSRGHSVWEFGLCCRDIHFGFKAGWPVIRLSEGSE